MGIPPTPEFERAVTNIGVNAVFRSEDLEVQVACLIREADWRPLRAAWWRGKSVCIIGADIKGNFFLRHCDGSVRYWRHTTQTDEVVAKSVREFARGIGSPTV